MSKDCTYRIIVKDDEVVLILFGEEVLPGGSHVKLAHLIYDCMDGDTIVLTENRTEDLIDANTVSSLGEALTVAKEFLDE